MEKALREGQYEEAGELQYSLVPKLEEKLAAAEAADHHSMAGNSDGRTYCRCGFALDRVPVDKMLEGERDKLVHMENG